MKSFIRQQGYQPLSGHSSQSYKALSPEELPEIEVLSLDEFLSEEFEVVDINLSPKEGWDGN